MDERIGSKEGEELCNTETEEGTVAVQKKRSRRVSFAEVTSVHVFDRDEDYSTPPEPQLVCEIDNGESGKPDEVLSFFRDLGDSDDTPNVNEGDEDNNEGDDDDDVVDARKSFFRPKESLSPASTVGSATSNDEDNFFGPVSSEFIRFGRLSDSAASDENHDITMDSTAFSMHFRSLARSDSGGDLRTPTGIHLAFEAKTPSQSITPTKLGSSMVLTEAKKPISQSSAPGTGDSNDMSLLGEDSRKYDYGRLSPRLNFLLAEGSKDLYAVPNSDLISTTISPSYSNKGSGVSTHGENGSGSVDLKYSGDLEPDNHGAVDIPAEEVLPAHIKLGVTNDCNALTPSDQVFIDCPSNKTDSSNDQQIQTPNRLTTKWLGDIILEVLLLAAHVFSGLIFKLQRCASLVALAGFCNSYLSTSSTLMKFIDSNVSEDICEFHLRTNALGSSQILLFYFQGVSSTQSNESIKDELERSRSKLDFSVVNRGILSSMGNRVLQLDLSAQDECALCNTEDWVNCPKVGTYNSNTGQNYDRQYESPLAGFIALSPAKQCRVHSDTADSSRDMETVTPEKRPGLFLSKESIKHGESVSSIQNTYSKIKILGDSHCMSTSKDGNDNLRLKSLDYLYLPLHSDMVLKENSRDAQCKDVGAPVACSEGDFSSINEKKDELESTTNTDGNETVTSKNIRVTSQSEETANKFVKSMEVVTSSTQVTWSGKKVPHLLTSENLREGTLIEYLKDKIATSIPENIVSPQLERLENRLSESKECEVSPSRDLNPQDQQDNFASFSSGQNGDAMEIVSGSHLTEIVHKADSLFTEKRVQCHSPLIGTHSSEYSTSIKEMDGGEISLCDMQNEAVTSGNFQTPLRGMDALNFQLGSPIRNLQTSTDPSRFKNEGIRRWIGSSGGSTFPYAHGRSTNKPHLQKSPTRKEPCDASSNDKMHSTVEKSSSRKRKSEDLKIRDTYHRDEIPMIQLSPKVHKSGGDDKEILLERSDKSNNDEMKMICDNTTLNNWADIFSKLSGDTKQLLYPLIDKLHLSGIDMLVDILASLQKVKTYELLCSDIKSQKGSDHLKNVRNKRASQTRLLLYKMIYEHAKGHLMRVKRERFLKRADLLTSGTKESQTLKNYFQHPFAPMAVDAQLDVSHSHSLTINVEGKHEVACDKVVSLRKEVRVSETKIEHLTNSFHTLCKMKGEPSCTDTIALVNDYLKKRTCCRLMSQHLQLWEVEDVDRRDGHHNVVLNYHGFIFQRFTLNAGPASSIIISNKFNDMKIMNNFPNMDACTAFAFMLKAETTRKKVGPRSLAQETQITSSLVSNLLDVIGEVHLARTELKDLVNTRFHSPSAEQLDLELCLIEFRSGMKVILTLDMTCLNRGVYPSEILPSELQAPKSMLVEIKSAVERVRFGYSRILRLCRCVSQALLSHTFPISSSSASAY